MGSTDHVNRRGALVPRVTRVVLWTTLTLLLLREALVGVGSLQRRAARAVTSWWDRVERHMQRETRHAEIDLVAGRLARKRPRHQTRTS